MPDTSVGFKLLASQVLLTRSKEMKITVCKLGTILRVIHYLPAIFL